MPRLRRPSPALLVAFLALLLTLGGTAVAARLISGRSIRKNSIPADRIRRNVLGGRQIAERKLGKVNRAKVADRAGIAFGAVNSQRVGNQTVQKVFWRVLHGTGEQLIVNLNGLQVYARCSAKGAVGARAVTQIANTQAQLGIVQAGGNKASGVGNGNFDPGESFDLDRGATFATGTFTYLRPDNVTAVLNYSVSGGTLCRMVGTLTSG